MKLEEYVAKRKKEDGINEFDFDALFSVNWG